MNTAVTARTRRLMRGHILFGITVFWVGCSQHQDLTAPPEEEPNVVVEIQIQNFQFSRPELSIAPGTVVQWRNSTSSFHTVTPDGHSAWSEWQTAGADQTFEVRFDEAGTYPYYCLPHRSLGMAGTIIVE